MDQVLQGITKAFSVEIMDIALYQYLGALVAILAGFILKKIADFALKKVSKKAKDSKYAIDDVLVTALEKPLGWAIIAGAIYVATLIIELPVEPVNFKRFAAAAMNGAIAVLIIWFGTRLLDGACLVWQEKASASDSRLDDQLVPIVRRTGKVFLILIGAVLVLQNLGYSVSSLLAGLGIGGAAVALASKDTVANLFGSIVIFLDRPFLVGDWIEMGGIEGTVEDVSLRTTRVRTFANSLITVPNAQFTTGSINNWSKMKKRRIKMSVGLTYDTTADQMQAAVEKIRTLLREDENILNDFFLVNFDTFGPSSLDIFIYCFTVTTNWGEYLEARQQLLLKIMRAMQEMGLSFAFPSQSVYVESLPGEPEAMQGQRPQ